MILTLLIPPSWAGGGPMNTIVLFNGDDAEATDVAERYGAARSLPSSHLCAVGGIDPTAASISIGDYEARVVPAIEACRADGIDVTGPYPGDTIFVRATRGAVDVVIACYHDQGLIPVKLLAFGQAVNVTIGLPIIRTSVDHGTAFDIAGQGIADHGSMVAAVLLAAKLARA